MTNKPGTQVANPFATNSKAPAAVGAAANSDAERSIQEVQAAMVIAKKFPRDQLAAMDRILNACARETLAEAALYSYQRGGTEITGPSIRLAEAMAQSWGNIQFGIRELSQENGQSTVEAFAWDIESNTRQVKVFQVSHFRHTRSGGYALTDPRDIYELVANNGARRLRACILGIIPGDVTEKAVEQCAITQQNSVDVSPESIKAMLGAFEKTYRVSQDHIEKRIQRRAEAINGPLMLSLRRIFQSLKDGMSKPADWFDLDEPVNTGGAKTAPMDESLAAEVASRKATTQKSPPDQGQDAQPEAAAAPDDGDGWDMSSDDEPSASGLFSQPQGGDE